MQIQHSIIAILYSAKLVDNVDRYIENVHERDNHENLDTNKWIVEVHVQSLQS